jgi:drug/metabolite transporter (DMT)-like permease
MIDSRVVAPTQVSDASPLRGRRPLRSINRFRSICIPSTRARALGALALAGLIWGTSDVAGKMALATIPPITLATLRFGIALIILLSIARRGSFLPWRNSRLALLGLIGIGGMFLLQNWGLERTAAANASMLQGAAPIGIVIAAALFLREAPGTTRVAGTIIALAGVVAITLTSGNGIRNPGVGDLYILGSAACFAAFVVLGRQSFRQYGSIPVLTVAIGWALAFLVPLSIGELSISGVGSVEMSTISLVLYLGAGCSALTYLLWGFALRHLEASEAAVFDNVVPVVGVIAAALVLQERPTSFEVLGGLLIVGGAWVTCRTK